VVAETELKSSRVQTPSSGTFTADEEDLKGSPGTVEEQPKADSTDEDSSSAGSMDEPGPRGRLRPSDHRWRSLDRRATSGDWNSRRRSTEHALHSPELSKRVAVRVRSADSRSAAHRQVSAGAPATQDRSPPLDTEVCRTDINGDESKTTEDLTLDIDSALAEVMSEIESLGLSHVMFSGGGETAKTEETTPSSPSTCHKTHTSSVKVARQDLEDAPDLVIGLPTGSTGPQSSPKYLSTEQKQISSESTSSLETVSSSSTSPSQITSPSRLLTAAEVFANADQCTIKKASAIPGPGPPTEQTSVQPSSSSDDAVPAVPSYNRPTPASRARSVDASTLLTSDGAQQSSSPLARRPYPVPKAKPMKRSEVGSKPFPTPADIRPDVEFVRAIVPPFGDSEVVATRTFTLPRDPVTVRGRPADPSGGSRSEVSRSMSVGDATATVDLSGLRPQPPNTRDPSPSARPPVKVKPPVMKKPARAGEVIKRLQESLAQQGGVSVSAPQ